MSESSAFQELSVSRTPSSNDTSSGDEFAMSSNETASDSSASSKVYTEDMLPTIICNGRFRVQYDKEGATREAALKILNEKKK